MLNTFDKKKGPNVLLEYCIERQKIATAQFSSEPDTVQFRSFSSSAHKRTLRYVASPLLIYNVFVNEEPANFLLVDTLHTETNYFWRDRVFLVMQLEF